LWLCGGSGNCAAYQPSTAQVQEWRGTVVSVSHDCGFWCVLVRVIYYSMRAKSPKISNAKLRAHLSDMPSKNRGPVHHHPYRLPQATHQPRAIRELTHTCEPLRLPRATESVLRFTQSTHVPSNNRPPLCLPSTPLLSPVTAANIEALQQLLELAQRCNGGLAAEATQSPSTTEAGQTSPQCGSRRSWSAGQGPR